MTWESKALERIIVLLAEEDRNWNEFYSALDKLGVQIDKNGIGYDVLREITEMDYLSENLDGFQSGFTTKEDFIKWVLEGIELKFTNKVED